MGTNFETDERSEDALFSLETGDFTTARELFGHLLEEHPDNPEFACGLYTAGFWDNRREEIASYKPGRSLGAYLKREWDSFEQAAEDRNYTSLNSYRIAMIRILGQAADQFRIAFQEEGGGSVDSSLLLELGITLMRIGSYKEAVEIFHYARRVVSVARAKIYFLLGESLISTGISDNYPVGLSFYRDGCLVDSEDLDPLLIAVNPPAAVFHKLLKRYDNDLEKVRLWFGAHLHVQSMIPGLRTLHKDERDQILWETERLETELPRTAPKYQEKVLARLAFYYFILLYHYTFHEKDTDQGNLCEDRLKDLFPDLYEEYKQIKKGNR